MPISRRIAAAALLSALAACGAPASKTGPARAVAPFTPEAALTLVNAYRAENGVLVGTAMYKEDPNDAGQALGACQLRLEP